MKVLSTSNPHAIISLAFSRASLLLSSTVKFFHKNFSSSVSCITRGTLKASCKYLVNMKGMRWPRCSASEEGPRPVYR
uniref:Pco072468 n=1 Tax=Arundo donax TaxID=35708 RepID=A0A0A9CNW0_ARUDO